MGVTKVMISEANEQQRIDNFLLTYCKGVPKTRIYRALRKGEVRVNQKRVQPEYRLQRGDEVRIPPLRMAQTATPTTFVPHRLLQQIESSILQETPHFLIVNKPSGIPVHGGSGISMGLIEALRLLRPRAKYLELAHRLDRETSGCLLVAKKRSVLVQIHQCWRDGHVEKRYLTLLKGQWQGEVCQVEAPLRKNQLMSGERIVVVDQNNGKPSQTHFRLVRQYAGAVLVEATLMTGRTHQIRVHAAYIGHPVAGDEKYGDRDFNKLMRRYGLDRLFLHSTSIYCPGPDGAPSIGLCAPLSIELAACLLQLSGAS